MGDAARESGPVWAPGYRHLTADLAPIPFHFRGLPEDFEVEELPLFEPSGEGTHLFVRIEKRGLATVEAVRRIAAALGLEERAIGFAGRKDARAVTRQTISIEHVDPDAVSALAIEGVKILSAIRHEHKLRVGQLAGNRFLVVLRDFEPANEERARKVLERLEQAGLPNYYGSQRFGRQGRTHELGRLLIEGQHEEYIKALISPVHAAPSTARDRLADVVRGASWREWRNLGRLADPEYGLEPDLARVAKQLARRPKNFESAARAVSKRTRQFHISALQSRIFNRVLALRLAEPEGLRPLAGDALYLHAGGATFVAPDPLPAEEAATLARRAHAGELVPSGPIPGSRMLEPLGRPAVLEAEALAAEGLAAAQFGAIGGGLDQRGARRPLAVPLRELDFEVAGSTATLRFCLPKGSYATTLLEELRKDHAGA